ncbi:MAG: hypothetical protein R2932_22105 [Caldilineaceae bacterium]
MITDAMFRLASGVDADQGWAWIFVGLHADAVEVIHMRRRGLRHIDIRVHHCNLGDLFARFRFTQLFCAKGAHRIILAGKKVPVEAWPQVFSRPGYRAQAL